MLSDYTFTPPLALPVLITLCACTLLFSLCAWQIQRLHWKEGLIAQLQTAMQNPARELATIPEDQLQASEFTKVTFVGRARPMTPVYMAARYYKEQVGYHVLLPVDIGKGKDKKTVLLNMGWIPADLRGHIRFSTTPQRYEGMIHLMGRKNAFTPDNQPARNLWFWYDAAGMEAYTKIKLLPVLVDRIDAQRELPLAKQVPPIGFSAADIHLRNDHLQYAIIWFLVGVAGLSVFVLYHVKRKPDA